MGIRSWLEKRRTKKVQAQAIDLTLRAVMRHLENGGKFEDFGAFCVDTPVWWNKKLQEWMFTSETSTLEDGDRVFMSKGRGGMCEFGNVHGEGIKNGVLEYSYVVKFGPDHRAGLDGPLGSVF
jgi:hypothetical protein